MFSEYRMRGIDTTSPMHSHKLTNEPSTEGLSEGNLSGNNGRVTKYANELPKGRADPSTTCRHVVSPKLRRETDRRPGWAKWLACRQQHISRAANTPLLLQLRPEGSRGFRIYHSFPFVRCSNEKNFLSPICCGTE